jgi:hypothetical protein
MQADINLQIEVVVGRFSRYGPRAGHFYLFFP